VETAVSPAKAVGVWQFIEETGRRYDLDRNHWFDRRRDPISSTRAAVRYLSALHREFQDWDLALAAYNSGAGTVRWARKVNRRAKLPSHYWALDLPDETQSYVPAFIASVLIAKNPAAYGFNGIDFAPALRYEEVKVSPGTSLSLLEIQLDMKERTLFNLNPELTRGVAPPGNQPYAMRFPPGLRRKLPILLAGVETKLSNWMLHHVQLQDTLQSLARRFSARPSKIKKVNGLQDNGDLLQRRFVIIPL
jgi:membrane-bound lytic murein transglycosylase D